MTAEPFGVVNTDPANKLYYDYYGFPKHYYSVAFESRGSPEMLEAITAALSAGSIGVERVKRDVDHGVFGAFAMEPYIGMTAVLD